MHCFSFLFCREQFSGCASKRILSRIKTMGLPHSPLWEHIHEETSRAHPGNGPQPLCCTRNSRGVCVNHPAGPSHQGSAQTQPVFSVRSLFFLDPSVDKHLHAVHVANIVDFHSKGRRNQCIQHITQCLENRFVFPLADFEVKRTQTNCETSNCHQRSFSLGEDISVLLLKHVTE